MPTVEQFINQLLQSQQRMQASGITDVDPSLVLGEALLRYQRLRTGCENPPLQLVVAGPTQAGKSSVMNWLLETDVAGVNALAGYTRHAQGFITGSRDDSVKHCLQEFFSGWKKTPQSALTSEQLEAYSLETVTSKATVAEQPWISWDSPDFDSVSSRSYRDVVLKLLALADLVLFVVSKEKYADQTVWKTLKLIQPLELPLLLCINKIPVGSAEELTASLQQRLAQEHIQATVIDLPYLQDTDAAHSLSERLQQSVYPVLEQLRGQPRAVNVDAFMKQHWPQWTAPVRDELAQQEIWQQQIAAVLADACQAYQVNYLHAPIYAETMQQAVVRLLELLEIPGLADTLGRARHALTWPARKLRSIFSSGSVQLSVQERQGQETAILEDIIQQALIALQHSVAGQITEAGNQTSHWWSSLLNQLHTEQQALQKQLQTGIKHYQETFSADIEQAAQQLYQHLQEHPVTLNSLRAARTTVDAAAVVLALKTGGIGLNDLVLTPAMLSFTSFLTEGAVGQFMQRVEKQLKKKQQQAVCAGLLQEQLYNGLMKMSVTMPRQHIYGITAEQLQAVERKIQDGS